MDMASVLATLPEPPALLHEWFVWVAAAAAALAGWIYIWKTALRDPVLAVRNFVIYEFVPMVRAVLREFDRAGESEEDAAKSTRELVRDVRSVQGGHAERLSRIEQWQVHHTARLDEHILSSDADSALLKNLERDFGQLSAALTDPDSSR